MRINIIFLDELVVQNIFLKIKNYKYIYEFCLKEK